MTRKTGAALCLLLWSASAAAGAADPAAGNASSVVRSPDGRLQLELLAPAGAAGRLRYRVTFSGHPVVEASNLGVRLANGTELGRETEIVGATPATIDESFEQYPGKRRLVADRANELTLELRERGGSALHWQLVLRAYDDGVALRYRFPAQPGRSMLMLADEATEFAFPAGALATILPLANFTTSHEARYQRRRVEDIPAGTLLGLPLGLIGVLFGPLIGAVAGEWITHRNVRRAGHVGMAAWIGFLIGTAVKIALAFSMIAIFVISRFWI